MEDCIFCKIAQKEIPSTVVYEDEHTLAFEDLSPQAPVHVLVVPKAHYASIADGIPDELLVAVMKAANKVATIKGIEKTGYRLVTNVGSGAGQTVFHFHVHVLGKMDLGEDSISSGA